MPMLLLSSILGRPVRAPDGTTMGRLRDVSARLDREHPLVAHLLVARRRELPRLLSWEDVRSVSPAGLVLGTPGMSVPVADSTARTDEILLRRDLLDNQIIDVSNIRTARVADVYLNELPNTYLEVAAVDIGIGAILRRLGVPLRLPERAVDFRDLHMTSGRGHAIQLATGSAAMHRLDAQGLAELLTRLAVDRANDVMQAVGPQRAAEALVLAHPTVSTRIFLALDPETADRVMAAMPGENAAHFGQHRGLRSPLMGRRLFRHGGWRLHRPPGRGPDAAAGP